MKTETTKVVITDAIFNAFEKWISQRAGLDFANYGDRAAYAQEVRGISKQRARARRALAQARQYEFNAAAMTEAFRAFSGRLQWISPQVLSIGDYGFGSRKVVTPHVYESCQEPEVPNHSVCYFCGELRKNENMHPLPHFSYTTGQYFPTEFAPAAAAVLEAYIDAVRPKHAPTPGQSFRTISDIKAAAYAAGSHWFDKSALRFFRGRVLPQVYSGPGGIYFVSSEDSGYGSGRRFTVRKFDPATADVETFGPFNELTRERAQRIARIASENPGAAKEALEAGTTL